MLWAKSTMHGSTTRSGISASPLIPDLRKSITKRSLRDLSTRSFMMRATLLALASGHCKFLHRSPVPKHFDEVALFDTLHFCFGVQTTFYIEGLVVGMLTVAPFGVLHDLRKDSGGLYSR